MNNQPNTDEAKSTKSPRVPRANKAFWDVKDIREYYGCAHSTVYRWVDAKIIPAPIKIGGSTRWRREDIEAHFATDAA